MLVFPLKIKFLLINIFLSKEMFNSFDTICDSLIYYKLGIEHRESKPYEL